MPGELRSPGGASVWHAMYEAEISFGAMISCLEYTKDLSENPGNYKLMEANWPFTQPAHNCTTTTVGAGSAAYEWLPSDWNPQDFGLDLKAMSKTH